MAWRWTCTRCYSFSAMTWNEYALHTHECKGRGLRFPGYERDWIPEAFEPVASEPQWSPYQHVPWLYRDSPRGKAN